MAGRHVVCLFEEEEKKEEEQEHVEAGEFDVESNNGSSDVALFWRTDGRFNLGRLELK